MEYNTDVSCCWNECRATAASSTHACPTASRSFRTNHRRTRTNVLPVAVAAVAIVTVASWCGAGSGSGSSLVDAMVVSSAPRVTGSPTSSRTTAASVLVPQSKPALELLNQARAMHEQRLLATALGASTTITTKHVSPSRSNHNTNNNNNNNWAETLFDDMTMMNLNSEVQELQRATGSEILNEQLQTQIDNVGTSSSTEAFLDALEQDASMLEKVAMSTIPLQLPRPAVAALRNNNDNQNNKAKAKQHQLLQQQHQQLQPRNKKRPTTTLQKTTPAIAVPKTATSLPTRKRPKQQLIQLKTATPLRTAAAAAAAAAAANPINPTNNSNPITKEIKQRVNDNCNPLVNTNLRVTHQEELELAKQVQRGVALHKLKTDFEAKHKREITRQEWTDLTTDLSTTKELRKQVVHYRKAKQLLVEANMGLVHAIVKSHYGPAFYKRTGITREELVQEGSLGLLRAAELFDPKRGLRFSTYATIWIKGTLSNSHMVEPITLPAREKTKWNKIQKAQNDIAQQQESTANTKTTASSPSPQLQEIASRVGIPVAEVVAIQRKMTSASQILSLDYEYIQTTRSGTVEGNSKGLNNLENDAAFRADANLAEQLQLRADVVATLAQNLDSREARLMRLRYGLSDGHTRSIHQCAQAMGLSQSRVQQLAKRCLQKLRDAQDAQSLQEYLLTIA